MRASVRQNVREQWAYRCGYRQTHGEQAGAKLTIDHFQPRSAGGGDTLENLVYCCHACNEFKGEYWAESHDERMLHPQSDDINAHCVERVDHVLVPLSNRGRLHIAVLHLNRAELVAARRRRFAETQADGLHHAILERLDAMEAEIRTVAQSITRLTGGIPAADNSDA